ncbi:hypothetical protein BDV18DRAFT_156843 [Aspergillus unguis]
MKPRNRFFSEGQCYFGPRDNPKTETHCNVWDWDRLKMVKVKGTARLFPPDEDVEVSVLARFADCLSQQVCAVTVDDKGLLAAVSTDPEEDDTPFVAYLPFSIAESLAGCRTVDYSRLQTLDRLGPGVDLSSYEDECGIPYIPGGTLDNPNIPFRLEWLHQLTQLVDFLNLELGVMHQDIAPRNLLIDSETDKILLFDFNWAAHGETRLLDGRDDVAGVVFTLYELITNDTRFASMPHWERDMEMVLTIPEWPCNRELDSDVASFRNVLDDWVATRKSDGELPTVLDYDVPYELGKTADGEPVWTTGPRSRRTAMEKGQYCFCWERLPGLAEDNNDK